MVNIKTMLSDKNFMTTNQSQSKWDLTSRSTWWGLFWKFIWTKMVKNQKNQFNWNLFNCNKTQRKYAKRNFIL